MFCIAVSFLFFRHILSKNKFLWIFLRILFTELKKHFILKGNSFTRNTSFGNICDILLRFFVVEKSLCKMHRRWSMKLFRRMTQRNTLFEFVACYKEDAKKMIKYHFTMAHRCTQRTGNIDVYFGQRKKKTLQHYILEQLKIFDKNPNDTIDTITGIVMILLFIYPRGVYLLIHGTHFRRIFVIIIYKTVDKMCVCAARTSSNRKYRSHRKSISTPSPTYGEDCDWRRRRWRRISHIHMSSYWRWCKNTIKWNKNHNNTNKCQIEQW